LTPSAPRGDNDDGVLALGYLVHSAREVVHYEKPKAKFAKGTAGEVLKIRETLYEPKKNDPDDWLDEIKD